MSEDTSSFQSSSDSSDTLERAGSLAESLSRISSLLISTGDITNQSKDSARALAGSGFVNGFIPTSYTAAELAAMGLPGIPTSPRLVRLKAAKLGWASQLRPRQDGPSERVFSLSDLPLPAQAAILQREPPTTELAAPNNTVPAKFRQAAFERARRVEHARRLMREGMSTMAAYEAAAAGPNCSPRSLRRWDAQVKGKPRSQWETILLPRGGTPANVADCHPDAWEYLKSFFLNGSFGSWSVGYRTLCTVAKNKGWAPIPSERTLRRRFQAEVPASAVIYWREGPEALANLYPAQERDRSNLPPGKFMNADGHLADVFVEWPDGEKHRAFIVAFQDLGSGFFTSFRIDKTESAKLVRAAFGDMCVQYGIPDECYFDNGRAFASKENTGGMKTRYRFTPDTAEAMKGVFTRLGVTVHWTKPYNGRAKPIERAWKNICENISKHPVFVGAYTGNSPMHKPHEYGSRAIPLNQFYAIVAALIAEENACTGRRSKSCNGRSFEEVFNEGYAKTIPTKLTEEQMRVLMLTSTKALVRRSNSCIHLYKNRYWCDALKDFGGNEVVVHYDHTRLHDGLYVYRFDGEFVGHAPCIEAVGFTDTKAASAHAKAMGDFRKANTKLAKAYKTWTDAELATAHFDAIGLTVPAAPPTTTVVRGAFGVGKAPAITPKVESTHEERVRSATSHNLILDVGGVGSPARSGLQRRRTAVNE